MRHRALGLAALVAALVAVGCSNKRPGGTVTGTVKYKGELVKGGDIFFVYADGQTQAAIRADGQYQFVDIVPGDVKVYIWNEAFNPEQRPPSYTAEGKKYGKGQGGRFAEYNKNVGGGEFAHDPPAPGGGLSPADKEKLAKLYVKLPKKYTDVKTTDLKYTVTTGTQVKDFELTD